MHLLATFLLDSQQIQGKLLIPFHFIERVALSRQHSSPRSLAYTAGLIAIHLNGTFTTSTYSLAGLFLTMPTDPEALKTVYLLPFHPFLPHHTHRKATFEPSDPIIPSQDGDFILLG